MSIEAVGGVAALGFAIGIAVSVPTAMWWYGGLVKENAVLKAQIEIANDTQLKLIADNAAKVDAINLQAGIDIALAVSQTKEVVSETIVYRDRPVSAKRVCKPEGVDSSSQAKTDPDPGNPVHPTPRPKPTSPSDSGTGRVVIIEEDNFNLWKSVVADNLKLASKCLVIQRESAKYFQAMDGLYVEAVPFQKGKQE